MKIGLMWYDDSPSTDLAEKVGRAVRQYRKKYGQVPDLCFVHKSAMNGNGNKPLKVGDTEVQIGRSTLPNHFWLGMRQKEKKGMKR